MHACCRHCQQVSAPLSHLQVAYDQIKTAPSRGALTTDFLLGTSEPLQYLRGLKAESYNGFNLVVGDFQSQNLAYFSNRRGQQPRELSPGLYGISNGVLDSKWPKVERGKARFTDLLSSTSDLEKVSPHSVFDMVMNEQTKVYEADELPKTGLPREVEQLMSSIFIQPCNLRGAGYGTRSQTLLIVHSNGSAQLHERSRPAQKADQDFDSKEIVWTEVHKDFHWSAEQNSYVAHQPQTCKS